MELTPVSETLFIPLRGRIYASKHHPEILYDMTALSLLPRLPKDAHAVAGESEYTLLASAVRSRQVDLAVQRFLSKNPAGTVINLGCGLETLAQRNGNGQAMWCSIDLPEVIALREDYMSACAQERLLAFSVFDSSWIAHVKAISNGPYLVVASGLFYYFSTQQVMALVRSMRGLGEATLVFDAVSSLGMRGTKHYMRKMGKTDAKMLFSLDHAEVFARSISAQTKVLDERMMYDAVLQKNNLKWTTWLSMRCSDRLKMVKMMTLLVRE